MSHPDDVTAVRFAMHSATFDLGEVAKEIIAALDAARAKRLPENTNRILKVLRRVASVDGIVFDAGDMDRAAGLLEAQVAEITNQTRRFADALTLVKSQAAEIADLRQQLDNTKTILTAAGYEIVPKGAVETEREACAKLALDNDSKDVDKQPIHIADHVWNELCAENHGWQAACRTVAAAIRARGKE